MVVGVAQTAAELNISDRRVRSLIASGDLVAEKVGVPTS